MPTFGTPLAPSNAGIPAVNQNSIGSFAGFAWHFPTFAGFAAAVTNEKANVAAAGPLWANRQPMTIATEPVGTSRTWSVALNHARTIQIRPGMSVVAATDAATVLTTTGVPAVGTGATDDIAVDYPGNVVYTKTGGAWAVTVPAIVSIATAAAAVAAAGPVLIATRAAMPSVTVPNGGTAGWNGISPNQPGVSGVTAIPITTVGSGMFAGVYPLVFSGGTAAVVGAAFATGTYTVGSNGTCISVQITNPGVAYSTPPNCAASGSPGGTLPTFTGLSIGASAREFNVHHSHIITEDCSSLIFRFGNFLASPAAPIQTDAGPGNLTLRVGVLVSGSNDPVQAYWASGSKDTVIEPGATAQTRPIAGRYLAGQRVFAQVRGIYDVIPVAWPASALVIETDGSEDVEFGTGLQDRTNATDPYFGPHVTPFGVLPAIAVLGNPLSHVFRPRVVVFGDSICSTGNNDNTFGDYIGFAQRALGELGIAFNNIGASGGGVQSFMNLPKASRARKYSAIVDAGINYCLTNFVTNDLSGTTTDTSQSVLSSLRNLSDEMLSFGIRMIPMTCVPRTNTTNNGINAIDTANAFTYRANFNAALRANNGVGYGYFDLALFTQEPTNNNLWRFDMYSGTIDGIHPNPANHTAMTAALKAALPALLVDPASAAPISVATNTIAQRGAATTASNGGSIALPTGSNVGDRFHLAAYGSQPATSLLTGFVSVLNGTDALAAAYRVMAKTLTSGDIASGTIGIPTGASWLGWGEFGSLSNSEESASVGSNYSNSATTAAVPASTSTINNSWHVVVFGDDQIGTNTVATAPAGYTLIGTFANPAGATNTLAAYRKTITPAGATGTPQLVWGTAGAYGFATGFISKA